MAKTDDDFSLVVGEDGLARPAWAATDPLMREYYDTEWGMPVRDERGVFERLSLEVFQAGLSWGTILRKREAFRAAFDGFDPDVVAGYGPAEVERLMGDAAWQPLVRDLEARFAANAARGEGLDVHARERALLALWLQGQPAAAWKAARTNLALQKEPLDWWLALQTSELSGDAAAHQAVRQALQQAGLQDLRLARWQTRGAQ